MNTRIIIVAWCALITSFAQGQQATITLSPDLVEKMKCGFFIDTSANHAGASQSPQISQQANHEPTQQTTINVEMKTDTSKELYRFLEKQLGNAQQHSSNAISWMGCNKLITACSALLASYGYIFYQIYQANLIINDPNSWCSWNSGRSLSDLFATAQSKLESDMLFAIQTRYVHPNNPTDFIYSIVQASNSLNAEIAIVQNQITRYTWINRCRSMELFFITLQELEILQEKLRKLQFIKHIFASWCANYKIDKNS